MKKALISVSDKTKLMPFVKELIALKYEILCSGGTFKYLHERLNKSEINHIIDIGKYTDSRELFSGRVKTIHPKIFGAILYKRGIDDEEANNNNIDNIDIVCVNFYPFEQHILINSNHDELIENIDIGGPSLVRAAAKNFKNIYCITDLNDAPNVIKIIKNNNEHDALIYRKELAKKAFNIVASYDIAIANYFNDELFPERYFIIGNKYLTPRYGENPHQQAAFYINNNNFINNFEIKKGELSFNNLIDLQAGINIAYDCPTHALCIIKHNNPCGFALKDNAANSFIEAFKSEPNSTYGGVIVLNGCIDKDLALSTSKIFIELMVAKDITQEALEILNKRNKLKIVIVKEKIKEKKLIKQINGGFLIQEVDSFINNNGILDEAKLASSTQGEHLEDLFCAYKIASFTKSNCVVFVKDMSLKAIGMGLTSRIDALKLAQMKAREQNISLEGSSLASEAFFPFRDSIDLSAELGVKQIIAPSGSIRDQEVMEAANEHKISLYFTARRHFLH